MTMTRSMMKAVRPLFIVLVLFVSSILAVEEESIMAAPASTPSIFRQAEVGLKLVQGNGDFAWNMYKKLAENSAGQNVFYSPLSISMALAMTYVGARSQTREQMRTVQGFAAIEDDSHVHESFEDLHTHLHKTDGNYTLKTANRIYAEKSFEVLADFLATTKTHYKAELSLVDFVNAYEAARLDINKWVEEQTNQKIKDLLAAGTLDSLTRMVLVNAIYFKGNWLEKFDPAKTTDSEFAVSATEKVPVRMMYQQKEFRYGFNQELNAKALELPYVGGQLSMLFVVPTTYHTLDTLLGQLTSEHIINFDKTFRLRKIKTQVSIPRFKLEQSIDLGDTLAAMGMPDLFDQSKADLSGINPQNQLFVSKVVHKAFIEVNEEGSEAAAATAVMISNCAFQMPNEFRADQPFLFLIRENQSNSILFLGRINKPSPTAATAPKEEL